MDAVTSKVLRMLEDDTIGAPDSGKKVQPNNTARDFISETTDHPVGDVSGKVKGPGLTGSGVGGDAQGSAQQPREAKKVTPNGMTDEMLRSLPNAMGRMARMGGVVEEP